MGKVNPYRGRGYVRSGRCAYSRGVYRRAVEVEDDWRGHVLCGGVMNVGDNEGRKELHDAYELGKSIQ